MWEYSGWPLIPVLSFSPLVSPSCHFFFIHGGVFFFLPMIPFFSFIRSLTVQTMGAQTQL